VRGPRQHHVLYVLYTIQVYEDAMIMQRVRYCIKPTQEPVEGHGDQNHCCTASYLTQIGIFLAQNESQPRAPCTVQDDVAAVALEPLVQVVFYSFAVALLAIILHSVEREVGGWQGASTIEGGTTYKRRQMARNKNDRLLAGAPDPSMRLPSRTCT
jgi:hypothetical protein